MNNTLAQVVGAKLVIAMVIIAARHLDLTARLRLRLCVLPSG